MHRGAAIALLVAAGAVLPGCASIPGSICAGACITVNVDKSQAKQEAPPEKPGWLASLAAAVLARGGR